MNTAEEKENQNIGVIYFLDPIYISTFNVFLIF